MHHSEGQQPKCLQTFFIDATMQANVGIEHFRNINTDLMTELHWMLQLNNSYVRSFVSIDKQLQSGLLPQSVSLELLADRRPTNEHRGHYNLPTNNKEIAILISGETCTARSSRSTSRCHRPQRHRFTADTGNAGTHCSTGTS